VIDLWTNAVITAYCGCALCCGEAGQPTASGRMPVAGITIAAPRSVPPGTWVTLRVPGLGTIRRRVDDRTSRHYDGRYDLYLPTHRAAQRFGAKTAKIRRNP